MIIIIIYLANYCICLCYIDQYFRNITMNFNSFKVTVYIQVRYSTHC